MGRNIAENLARLGIDVTLVSAVGADDFGRQLIKDAAHIGINTTQIVTCDELSTASYTAIHDASGELLYAVADMRLYEKFTVVVSDGLKDEVACADAVVVDANLSEVALERIAQDCAHKMIVAEGVSTQKCLRLSGVLSTVTLLKVNRAEALALVGREGLDNAELLGALHALGPPKVLMSLGDDGVMYSDNGEQHLQSALTDITMVSTSGAGDAMLSGVVAAMLSGCDVDEQLHWGTRAAALTLGAYSACAATLSRTIVSGNCGL